MLQGQRWGHQDRGVRLVSEAIARGSRKIILTSPTGSGKTAMILDLAQSYLDQGLSVIMFTNRRLLLEQTSKVMALAGQEHGLRAAGHGQRHERPFQIASIQTEHKRSGKWEWFPAELVLLDEAHLNRGGKAMAILERYHAEGAAVVGVTATPLDLPGFWEELVVAGSVSDCRDCGALVSARHYSCGEPDLKLIGPTKVGEDLSDDKNHAAVMRPGIFGRVIENWLRHNPEQKPTILFGPSVAASQWFAEQFTEHGVEAAHIDGESIWWRGETIQSSPEAREKLLGEFRAGTVKVICNRFVMREGIDLPQAECGILATVIGSLSSYLQLGGRLLRAFPGKESAIILDHGGSWHRHGSLNADREFSLGDTNAIHAMMRRDLILSRKCRLCKKLLTRGPRCLSCGFVNEVEPTVCPACGKVLTWFKCSCGWVGHDGKRSRPVVQHDGTLSTQEGDVYVPKRIAQKPSMIQAWEKIFYRCRNSGRTFAQAIGLFAYEQNGWHPNPEWPLMPTIARDKYRRISDVDKNRLIPRK